MMALSAFALLSVARSPGAIVTWDGGGANANWETAGNWNIAGTPTKSDSIVFGVSFSSGTTIDMNGNQTASSLTISSTSGFTIANGRLTLTSGDLSRSTTSYGEQIISSAIRIQAAADWNVGGLGFLEISGNLDDSNRTLGFTKTGGGTLILSGSVGTDGTLTVNGGTLILSADNYGGSAETQMKGNIVVNAGVLNVRHNDALGTLDGSTRVNAGAALQLQGGLTMRNEALTLNGNGVSNDGALRNVLNNNTYTGAITLGSAARINSDSGTLTIDVASGNAITGSQNLTIGGNGNVTLADPIATSTGTLTKDGTGTLTLSAANTYTGTTTVSAGTLVINGNQSSATGAVSVSGKLAGTGTIGGTTTINAGGTYSPGPIGAVGNQNFTKSLTFANQSIFDWDLNANSTTSGFDTLSASGNIAVGTTGSIFRIAFGSGVDLNNAFWTTPNATRVWNLTNIFGKAFSSGSFQSVQTSTDVSQYGSFSITGSALTWTAVPEPSGAIAGLLIAAGLLRRRRK